MSHWFPESSVAGPQSGIAMVVALLLLLVITLMGMGIAYMANVQSDMVAAVVNKPLSIDAAETCFDNAIEWLSTSPGKTWVNGSGYRKDLVVDNDGVKTLTLLRDTVPIGSTDNRSAKFQEKIGLASYDSCIVEKIATSTNGNTGNEIGTSNGYGDSSFVYTIKIIAVGNYNAPIKIGNAWSSNVSKSTLEAVVEFVP